MPPKPGWKMSVEGKEKIRRARLGMKFSDEHRANISAAVRRQIAVDPEAFFKRARKGGRKGGLKPKSEATRKRMSAAAKKRWASGVYASVDMSAVQKRAWAQMPEEKKHAIIAAGRKGHRMTTIEQTILDLLEAAYCEVEYQVHVGPYVLDFYVPHLNLYVEVDGAYWHSLPKTVERDRRLEAFMRARGLHLVRIGEVEAREIGKGAVSDCSH